MKRLTIQPALVAFAVVALEALLAAIGLTVAPLSAAALVVAPGLALVGLLPERTRASWPALLAAAPGLGLAAVSVALVTVASVGAPLDGVVVRAVAMALVLIGLGIERPFPQSVGRADLLASGGLAGALGLSLLLQQRVIGDLPVPGNDWAKYVLYADEIQRQGSLLIDNPFWMLGVPFREDPGTPAVYAAYLSMTGKSAQTLVQGIGALAAIQVLSVFALVRSLWTPAAAVAAAALWAAVPMDHTILAWHGLANVAALALLPLVLLYASSLLEGDLDPRTAAGAGLLLVAVAAAHRLSLTVALGALAVAALGGVLLGRGRAVGKAALALLIAAAALSPGVAYDLITRGRTFGGTQSYTAYLSSKLDFLDAMGDLTLPLSLAGIAATVLALSLLRRERPERLLPLLGALAVTLGLAFAWLVHLPLHYTRMAYYLPLALVPLVAAALAWVPRPRLAAGVAVVLVGWAAVVSFVRTDDVRTRYAFASPASLKGLDRLDTLLRPREVVVTDRCWSFLSAWLVHRPVLAALEPVDIQPKAEVPRAREARAILAGTPEGRAVTRRLRIRFAVVDPTCTDSAGDFTRPPEVGRPLFVSRRLVLLRLPRS
jgi:hypothetical protein